MAENMIEAIQSERNRVRELLPYYAEIGPAGAFGALMLKQAISEGESAIASDDVVRMLHALASLRDCEA